MLTTSSEPSAKTVPSRLSGTISISWLAVTPKGVVPEPFTNSTLPFKMREPKPPALN